MPVSLKLAVLRSVLVGGNMTSMSVFSIFIAAGEGD